MNKYPQKDKEGEKEPLSIDTTDLGLAFSEEVKDNQVESLPTNDLDLDYTRERVPSNIVDGRDIYSQYGRDHEESPD